jgi:MFS family permease
METTKSSPYTWKTVFLIVGVAWGSAAYGYAASIIGTTLGQPSFLKYMGLLTAPNAADLIGTMNGLFYAGGFIGAMGIAKVSDRYGRKVSIALGAVIILISNALLAGSVNVAMFIVFRFFQGIG